MHPSNKLIPVFATQNGLACHCIGCEAYQVTLGNAVISVHPSGIPSMLSFIASMSGETDMSREERVYILQPDKRPYAFAFNYDELQELRELLEGTQAMQSLNALVQDTLGNANTIY